MTDVLIQESLPPLEEATIAEVESQLGITLPDDYRAFLLKYNGGHPEPSYFPIADNPSYTQGILDLFYCIRKREYNDIRNKARVFRGRMPENLLPIAADPGGNQICLSVDGLDRGSVYFWDHEGEDDEPTYENVYFVAKNFTDLLGSLSEPVGDRE